MIWKTKRVSRQTLLVLMVISIVFFMFALRAKVPVQQPYYREKLRASQLALRAQLAIKNYKRQLGLQIDPVNDPNETGMIGPEYTLITTDRGDIDAKLTSTNPNFAAVMVEMFKKAGLKKGDYIAIGQTGSFPALNIAVLAAARTLRLRPIIITSVGSSSFGANEPELTWLDMESLLRREGILPYKSAAASMGGSGDIGRGLSPKGRRLILEAIRRNKVRLIREDSVRKSIDRRMEIYFKRARQPIACYVNIGGGVASLGASINGRLIPPGLSKRLTGKVFPTDGVITLMAKRGIPIIHLLEIERIAERYGLPISPVPIPEVGDGDIFYTLKYNVPLIVLITAGLTVIIFVIIRLDLVRLVTPSKKGV